MPACLNILPRPRSCLLAFCLGASVLLHLPAQEASSPNLQPTSAAVPARTIQGRVLDALHGTPLPRALVHLNARAVLTDAEGRFAFPQFTEAQAYASVTKPGYAAADAADGPAMIKVADLDAALELKLFPDAVITGTLTARDGSALGGVGVQLLRANYDVNGVSAVQVRYTVTDSHGAYRFSEPAGRYRVVSRYLGSMPETGQSVLTVAFPAGSSSAGSGYFVLTGGEEKHINLRPVVGMAAPVELKVDGIDEDGRRNRLRVGVEAEGGVPFATQAIGEGASGLYRLSLPPGSYSLQVTAGGRDEPLEGTVRATVSAHGRNSIAVHLAEPAIFPVEVSLDPSVQVDAAQPQASQPPTPAQLNLSLHSLGSAMDAVGDVRLHVHDGSSVFSVPAGRYRLISAGAGAWFVSSASLGPANLAGGEITVAGGAGGTPIRLVVGNATGQLTGTVAMGDAPSVWLYLIAREPRLTPYYLERVGATGAFTCNVPPGTYTAVAVESRIQEDLHDRAAVEALAGKGKEITVVAGGKASVDLALAQTVAGIR